MIYGRPDPQEEQPVAYCDYCGGEIYPGDSAYIPAEFDGMLHADCVKDWLYETYAWGLGVWCEVSCSGE
ncbi:hypothetical protein [Butyricicoccus porcorum]|uniref:Uncharacterized protein n=1 Tax=Butyricicoccus porcorum TaxID=1945634 RepID=A0A252F722_9FIRM|nr:hypothetical protein [Butyricicoccus porcorum]OUM21561.1 hypothetical protein CBW42_03080 [Butyricicoccus porcorum]